MFEETTRIHRNEDEDKVAYFVSVEWSKKTTGIQRDEEEDEISTLYP